MYTTIGRGSGVDDTALAEFRVGTLLCAVKAPVLQLVLGTKVDDTLKRPGKWRSSLPWPLCVCCTENSPPQSSRDCPSRREQTEQNGRLPTRTCVVQSDPRPCDSKNTDRCT